ncbi:expressed unknown protein [Seminavis robusta]|uniref:Uncharacterized protein n=1 Tax=Seminavis robusta TaxID=568900 RepID=A0A9N8EIL2_9STRA|nr:expressed unknown protein [Seminavis robusta]|eukprot:Sro1229_g254491.1  (121) ;mRNA; r:29430-29792
MFRATFPFSICLLVKVSLPLTKSPHFKRHQFRTTLLISTAFPPTMKRANDQSNGASNNGNPYHSVRRTSQRRSLAQRPSAPPVLSAVHVQVAVNPSQARLRLLSNIIQEVLELIDDEPDF